jgi:hypothetical protein
MSNARCDGEELACKTRKKAEYEDGKKRKREKKTG